MAFIEVSDEMAEIFKQIDKELEKNQSWKAKIIARGKEAFKEFLKTLPDIWEMVKSFFGMIWDGIKGIFGY